MKEKITPVLVGIGSVLVSAIGCFLIARGAVQLSSPHLFLAMFGAACLMLGVYDFWYGIILLAKTICKVSGRTTIELHWTIGAPDEKENEE